METVSEMLHRVNEQGPLDEAFSTNVKLRVISGDPLYDVDDYPDHVYVKFKINVEYKSWGMASLELVPVASTSFTVRTVETWGKGPSKTHEVVIDFDKISDYEMEWEKGGTFTIDDMDVTIDENGVPVEVTLSATYIGMD